jgi:hypothetical protein
MVRSLLIGATLTVACVGIHAVGTTWLIEYLRRIGEAARQDKPRFALQLRILCTTALSLLGLHVLEVFVWSATYLALPIDDINGIEQATYFSMVSFTSLGYGDLVIKSSWRVLGATQAMAGLLLFGWSTAFLFAVVQRLWGTDGSQVQS